MYEKRLIIDWGKGTRMWSSKSNYRQRNYWNSILNEQVYGLKTWCLQYIFERVL